MILLIEDNAGDVVLFQKALDATLSHCTVAHNAEAGIALLAQAGTDITVVVVDLRLPGVDGWAVLEYLRGHPQCKVEPVIFTSSANERDRDRAASLGAPRYWMKPDDFETLQKIVRDISALDQGLSRR
jgi:CheY-like chemotaxis protein